jgi:hypothetical protein
VGELKRERVRVRIDERSSEDRSGREHGVELKPNCVQTGVHDDFPRSRVVDGIGGPEDRRRRKPHFILQVRDVDPIDGQEINPPPLAENGDAAILVAVMMRLSPGAVASAYARHKVCGGDAGFTAEPAFVAKLVL